MIVARKPNAMKKLITLCWIGISCSFLTTPLFSQNEIEGKYVYVDKAKSPLQGVEVFLKDMDGNVIATTFTNEKGKYLFKNVKKGNYEIDADYDRDFGHVGFDDLFAMRNHIIGIKKLEGIFLLAADIDENGVINWVDYNYFIKDWFLKQKEFPKGKWYFEKRYITEENWSLKDGNGFGDGIANGLLLPPPPPPGCPKDFPLNTNLRLNTSGILKQDFSNTYNIPLYYQGIHPIGGYGLVMEYSTDLIDIKNISNKNKDINYNIENGKIRISWLNTNTSIIDSNEPLLTLNINLKTNQIPKKQLFKLKGESHLIDNNGHLIENASLSIPSIENTMYKTVLNNIYPNPVRDHAKIEYKLATTSTVKLSIFSSNGQQVAELINIIQKPGNYQIKLNTENYNLTNGTYIYRLDCVGKQMYSESKTFVVNR
jgi:hypothetical protein